MEIKYLVFSTVFVGYAIFAFNRKSVSFVIPNLIESGLGNQQIGFILSCQNLAYAISKFIGGIVSDHMSARILFTSGLLFSGLTVILFSVLEDLPLLSLVWFGNGLAQGVGWPAIAKLLKNWFKPEELGTWWSLASSSANLAGCVAPMIASFLILNSGWRVCLQYIGLLTFLGASLAYLFLREGPVPEGNAPQKKKILSSDKTKQKVLKKEEDAKKKNYLGILIKTRFIWILSICYMVSSCIKTCITDWSQIYLMRECNQSSLVASSFVSSVEFGGFFGGIAAGYVSDLYMKSKVKNSRVSTQKGQPRMTIAVLFAITNCVFLFIMYYYVTKFSSMIFIDMVGIIIGASVYGQIAIFGVVAAQSVDSEMSGTAHAIVALAANAGSIMAGLPFASIAKYYSWRHVFFILEIVAVNTVAFMIFSRNAVYRVTKSYSADKKSE